MNDKENITHYYLDLYDKYQKKYGENTIILMEVGSFFEMYGIETEEINKGKVTEISSLLNIQCTKKDKAKSEENYNNPRMAGFPSPALSKYINIILDNNYTVVLVEQTTPPPKPERKVTRILSPGTNFDNMKNSTSNLMSIYIEKLNNSEICIGISVIDVITGKNSVFETQSRPNDKDYGYEEIFRMIQVHNPTEIILYSKNIGMTEEMIISYFEIENTSYHIYIDSIDDNIQNLSYQNKFLEKIFKPKSMLTVIEYLDLERMIWGTISYIALLQFAYEHDERILNKLEKPCITKSDKLLLLANNTIQQLNITSPSSNNQNNSLLGLLNKCSTAMGKRLFKERLLNPIKNIDLLNERYENIEKMINNDIYLNYEKLFKNINDIERLQRRLSISIIHPCEFSSLYHSYITIKELINLSQILFDNIVPSINIQKNFDNFIKEFETLYNLDKMYKYNIDKITNNIFNKDIYSELDQIEDEIISAEKMFTVLKDKLSEIIYNNSPNKSTNSELVKIDYNDRDGKYLSLTKKRFDILQQYMKNNNNKIIFKNNDILDTEIKKIIETNFNFKEIDIKHDKSNTKISSKFIKKYSNNIILLKEKMKKLANKYYIESLEKISLKYINDLNIISNFVAELDIIKTCAKLSISNKYTKPIINTKHIHSYIKVSQIRHPIIEKIQREVEYVPNDIILGKENSDGVLLYSVNAAGKSSLMKSVGINIIMAQAGMFVAADYFEFRPYSNIFTRISGNDNLFKGQSSFAVEMSELRGILKRSDAYSLVLGDELCSGTETNSALAIVAAGIKWLSSKNTSFIFATHLHQLSKMEIINNLTNVKHYHLKVEYDPITKKLIYNRKLEQGSGLSIYGLEVCKAMDLDKEFLEMANTIRQDIANIDKTIISEKKSKYNANILIDKCYICNKNAEDVHHIKFQCNADKNNMIGNYHKNIESNLVCLCKDCHDSVHNGNLDIKGYIKTSDGIVLDYHKLNDDELKKKKNNNKKFSNEQLEIIRELKKQNTKIIQKNASTHLKKINNIDISPATVSKIWNNKY